MNDKSDKPRCTPVPEQSMRHYQVTVERVC